MIKYFIEQNKFLCCGCRACEYICTFGAITMQTDEEGFLYPFIDLEKCTKCGLCAKVCSITNADTVLYKEGIVYAARNNDVDIVKRSSSGGIFSLIADYVIDILGGVVYGAAFDDNFNLSLVRITQKNELIKLRGSKYLQANTNDTFKQVKNDLKIGNYVYYTGTPCQIAGLRLFLGKDSSKLITSDLICHGVPSQALFSNCIKKIEEEKGGKIINYSFRDKTTSGWACSSSSSTYVKGRSLRKLAYNSNMQAYFNSFISRATLQYACYSCPFRRKERAGDLTLADYWSIRKDHPDFPNIQDGVSLVILNTDKAITLWEKIAKKAFVVKSEINFAFGTNKPANELEHINSIRKTSYNLAFHNYKKFKTTFLKDGWKFKMKTLIKYNLHRYSLGVFIIRFIGSIKNYRN